ncbi:MAG: flagellar hook-basal body protein [Candidatus Puniceispirillaceae bacterium]
MISVIRSGLDASMKQISVLSNNIANARTTGFKKSMASFQDVYAQKASLLNPGKIGHGARTENVRPSQVQGPLTQTDQTLDLAVEGQGMFVVKRADDTDADAQSYTRDGSFSLDNEGFMITTNGHRVLSDQGQFLQVPLERIIGEDRLALEQLTIDEYGNVRAQLGRNRVENVGRVGLALFADINRLTPVGNNLFKANEASGAAELGSGLDADGLYGKVLSGALEMANTDMTSELSVLIQAQQAFSGSSRMLQAETDMTKRFTSR